MADTEKINVVGTDISLVDYSTAVDNMQSMVEGKQKGYVVAAASHALMTANEDPEMRKALDRATMVVPDGMPVKWAANALGARLTDRVYGPELMKRFCQLCGQKGYRVWLYGGYNQDSVDKLSQTLVRL